MVRETREDLEHEEQEDVVLGVEGVSCVETNHAGYAERGDKLTYEGNPDGRHYWLTPPDLMARLHEEFDFFLREGRLVSLSLGTANTSTRGMPSRTARQPIIESGGRTRACQVENLCKTCTKTTGFTQHPDAVNEACRGNHWEGKMIDLDAIEKLLAEANPAPWIAQADEDNEQEGSVWCGAYEDERPAVCGSFSKDWPLDAGDAETIAALRNAAPTLLALAHAGRRLADEAERLMARIDFNGGIGEYEGGPAFVMKHTREALAAFREADGG